MSATSDAVSCDVLIVGGGAAGIATAALLRRRRPGLDIAIVEPHSVHCYQPGWTLVGAGVMTRAQTERPEVRLIPPGVRWMRSAAAAFDPDNDRVDLVDGRRVSYRRLVACPGLKTDWAAIPGLAKSLGRNGVCSNYSAEGAQRTWQFLQQFRGGTALFTQPPMPIKCPGAPQKIVYLAADHFRRSNILNQTRIEFHVAGDALFGVGFFVPVLKSRIERYGIDLHYHSNLKSIDGDNRIATFAVSDADGTRYEQRAFDLLHAVPPQGPLDVVRDSPLANAAGWIDVDQVSLRHVRYGNVWGLGDATSTPNSKTAAAVRMQSRVVVDNLLADIDGLSNAAAQAAYDGYASCPLTVSYDEVVMAEFGYGGRIMPTLPLDPRVPRRSMWELTRHVVPRLYWDVMLRGHTLDIAHRPRDF